MSNKVLIIPDSHIGGHANLSKNVVGSAINTRLVDQLNLLDWALDQAIYNDVDNIIMSGDIFDSPQPPSHMMANFISWLQKCNINNIFVHIITGNHDLLRNGFTTTSSLDIITEANLDNVSVYKDIDTIFIGNSAFTLMPFRDRKSFGSVTNSEALELIQNILVYENSSISNNLFKVVVGHFALEGSIPVGDEIDDITNELFCPISMFSEYDYVWMGHVHKPQVLNKNKPYVAHIGSMDISNFGETDHKKIIVIYDCDRGSFIHNIIPTRNLKKIIISVPKDSLDSTEYVLQELKKQSSIDKSIIKVEISLESQDSLSVNKAKIEKYLNDAGAFTIAGIHESKKISLIKRDSNNTINTSMDMHDAIKKYSSLYVKDENKDNFISLSMDLVKEFKADNNE